MGMPAIDRVWTAAAVRELMDESRPWPRYELVEGELLVTPAPRPVHQRVVRELTLLLHQHARAMGLGDVLASPADLALVPESVLQPDIFVIPAALGRVAVWPEVTQLLLVVEVVSPSSARTDRVRKRRFFQAQGVPEYWVVDSDSRTVERWRPGDERPEILHETLEWEGLRIDLEKMFAGVM